MQGKDIENYTGENGFKEENVFEKLSYLRLLIEKLKPLDKKIDYQVDKLLKSVISRGPDASTSSVSLPALHSFNFNLNRAK